MTKITCTLVYLLSIILLISNCKRNEEHRYKTYGLENFKAIKDKKECKIYVIPNSGCSSCISSAESYAVENSNSDSIIFVFTRITSLKLFKNRFKESFYKKANIVLDTTNLFVFPNPDEEIYPMFFNKYKDSFSLTSISKP